MSKMKTITSALAVAAVAVAAVQVMAQEAGHEAVAAEGLYERAVDMYEAAYPQDPADSLYRAARDRLNWNAYRDAARLFREVYRQYPRSSYAAQSYYYEAFALYRLGSKSDLRAARDALRVLQSEYVEVEVAHSEAEQLMARVQSRLAELGDEQAARELVDRARELEEEWDSEWQEGDEWDRCSQEDEVRMAALHGLLNMNPQQAKPILRKVLERTNECPEIRTQALMILSQSSSEEDLPIFLEVARNDPNPDVRAQAVMWIMNIPGDASIGALGQILMESDDLEIQQAALMALAQHRDERAIQRLREYALRDDVSTELRAQAIMWVGHDGSEESKRFLRQIYDDTEEREIKEGIFMTLATQYGHDDSETGRWMLSIAMDESEDGEIRRQAMYWAAQSGLPVSELAELYESVDDREMKEAIWFALVQSDDDDVVDVLLRMARAEKDPDLRADMIFWLSQRDDPRVREFLLEIIEGGGG